MENKEHKPFSFMGWLAPIIVVVGVLLTIFEPSIAMIKMLWPIWLGTVLVGATFALMKFGGEKVQDFLKLEWVKKFGSGLLALGVIASIFILLRHFAEAYLGNLKWSPTEIRVVISLLTPFIVYAVWSLTNLPGDSEKITWSVALICLCWLGIEYYDARKTEMTRIAKADEISQSAQAQELWKWSWEKEGKTGGSNPLTLVLRTKKTLHFKNDHKQWVILNFQGNGLYIGNWGGSKYSGTIPKFKFKSPFHAEGISIGSEGDVAQAVLKRIR